jgi:hypothetical protein
MQLSHICPKKLSDNIENDFPDDLHEPNERRHHLCSMGFEETVHALADLSDEYLVKPLVDSSLHNRIMVRRIGSARNLSGDHRPETSSPMFAGDRKRLEYWVFISRTFGRDRT